MKMAFWQRLAVLTLLGWGISSLNQAGRAAQFEHQEIEQEDFIVLAAPGGDIGYKLLILEQLTDSRPCWSETGSNPSTVEPLLLSFDFTGICNRLVDSNGFSVRTAGQDQGLQYSLRIVRKGEELVLVAASNSERDAQIEIGRTYGMPTGFSRIVLDPGWRLTRRAFNGRAVGHMYLTYDQPMEMLLADSRRNSTFASRAASMSDSRPFTSSEAATNSNINANPPSGVIPVPSLPPATASSPESTARPTPLPPLNTRPAPLPSPAATTPQTGTTPSLSSILPPPPPSTSVPAPFPDTPAVNADEDSAAEASTPDTPSTPNSAATQTSPTRPPVSVPRTSNSGGAPLRPRSLRREEPTTATRPSTTTADQDADPNSETALAQAETYQVVVVADSAEVQDKVRALAPNAFLTTINGQVVMQVGVFRERVEADRLQQKLSLEGLPTAVIPVR